MTTFDFKPRTTSEQVTEAVRSRYARTHFFDRLRYRWSAIRGLNAGVRVQIHNLDECKRPMCVCCGEEPGHYYAIKSWPPEYPGSGDDMVCGECGK